MNKKINLIRELTYVDLKLKYYGSYFGFLWSLLKPLMMLGILYVVFTYFIPAKVENYGIFLLIAILLWNFFVDATFDSMSSIVSKKQIITKTTLSPSIIVIVACIHNFISFLLNFLVFMLFFYISDAVLPVTAWLFIPLTLIFLFTTFSTSLILIILNSRFSDFKHIWSVFLQVGFWITPIVYPLSFVPLEFQRFFMLNPIARVIIHSREVLLYGVLPTLKQTLITVIFLLLLSAIFIFIYKKFKEVIVDSI